MGPWLSWRELANWLQGWCTRRSNAADAMWECFDQPFKFGDGRVVVDFPNCLGYDFETQGLGLITANPEDSPMTLSFFTDDKCTVASDQRRSYQKHCWEIESGAEWNINIKAAFKLV